jgi:hypothetical protein
MKGLGQAGGYEHRFGDAEFAVRRLEAAIDQECDLRGVVGRQWLGKQRIDALACLSRGRVACDLDGILTDLALHPAQMTCRYR